MAAKNKKKYILFFNGCFQHPQKSTVQEFVQANVLKHFRNSILI